MLVTTWATGTEEAAGRCCHWIDRALCLVIARILASMENSVVWFDGRVLPCLLHEDEHLLVVNKPAGLNTHSPSPYAGEESTNGSVIGRSVGPGWP